MKQHLSPREYIQDVLKRALKQSFEKRGIEIPLGLDLGLESKNDPAMGQLSATVAFSVGPIFNQSPKDVASEIVQNIEDFKSDYIQSITVAGNGFINFFLNNNIFFDSFENFSIASLSVKKHGKRSKIIVEFSSPNVAKPFHVGHLRNTVLGEFLSRLHEFAGYKVIRWNHLGDWGTQFGKLLVAYKKWGDQKRVDANPITELLSLYVRFTHEAKINEDLDQEARDEFSKLEKGDPINRKLLNWFLKETVKELSVLYKRLNVTFDVIKGESFYISGKKSLFDTLAKKGLLQESEGAKIISLDEENMPPVLLEKSDGATLYHTRDLLSLQYRIKKYRPKQILYVVGNEQTLYLSQMFAVAKIAGLSDADLKHVAYGLVFGFGKKKLSTREGNIITAQEIIRDTLMKSAAVVHEKHPNDTTRPPVQIVEQIALGAIKYNLLKEGRLSDVMFDFDKMLSFNGNSSPYLQYTYARISKILTKVYPAGIGGIRLIRKPKTMVHGDDTDISVMKKIIEFPESLEMCLENLSSHPLTEYLFSLANELNAFYEKNPILKDEDARRRKQRLYMLKISAEVIKQGLYLLGIEAPKMI